MMSTAVKNQSRLLHNNINIRVFPIGEDGGSPPSNRKFIVSSKILVKIRIPLLLLPPTEISKFGPPFLWFPSLIYNIQVFPQPKFSTYE